MPTAMMTPLVRHLHKLAGADERLSDAELLNLFCRDQDAHAFRLLVQRHGPMVLGICRRALGMSPDCEDAFQATFLVLVRKAKRIRRPELLGNWLFGVARRIALRAKSRAIRESLRRRPLDDQFVSRDGNPNRNDGITEVIDDAVARLPAKYRVPIVLCCLQGHSQADAAERLGCAVSTISTRIARAKARLRAYLMRQGMTAASAMQMASLTPELLAATVPAQLGLATRTAATALGGGAAGTIPVSILALTKGIGDAMILHSWKLVGAAVIAVTVGGTMTGVSRGWLPSEPRNGPSATFTHRVESQPSDDPPKPRENTERPSFNHSSENFMIANAGDAEARVILNAAEEWREKLARQWIGAELPNWPKKCPITARLDGNGSAGATTFNFDFKGGVEFVSMRLSGSLVGVLGIALPHEVMHTVLATHFKKPLPRWADEGAAVIAAESEETTKYHASFDALHQLNKHLSLRRLFAVKDFNEVDNVILVYAQGATVTRFLVERKDRPTFLRFLSAGMNSGWESAAKDIYDFASIEAMEQAWLKNIEDRKSVGDAQPFREPAESLGQKSNANSPLPFENRAQVARAVIDDEGRLVLKALVAKPNQNPGSRRRIHRESSSSFLSGIVVKNCMVMKSILCLSALSIM